MRKILQFYFFPFFLFLLSQNILAQPMGIISGKIIDANSGESIIGANIILEGTTIGAASDIDGNYSLKNIPEGKYKIVVSYISYTKTIIKDVIVSTNNKTVINISLKPETIEISEEVVVTGERNEQYEAALLNKRKNSIQISDGISAEQIKRSTDNTTAETLRRVPGLTLLDNKYIYVRGVSERYNGALLNNSPLASSEPDKRDFAFDLIPSNLIDNTIVVKSFTPDEPGDFAGGLVKVNTIEFPTKTIFSFNYSSSFVNDVSTKSFRTYQGSNTDYLGIDDGFRDLPDGFPDPATYKNYASNPKDTSRTYWSKKFNDKWGLLNNKAFLDQSFGITYGERLNLFDNDFGVIGSLTYKTGFNSKDILSSDLRADGTYYFDYTGSRQTRNVYWGGIVNLSYKIGDFNKIGFKNLFTISSDDEVTTLQGPYTYNSTERLITALHFISRNLYSGQLSGSSFISLITGIQLDWRASYSSSNRSEPDFRRSLYIRNLAENGQPQTEPFLAYFPRQEPDENAGGRYYSNLDDYKRGAGFDLGQNISSFKIKYGVNHFNSSRSFNARTIGPIDPFGIATRTIGAYAMDSLYSQENFAKRYIIMNELYNAQNDYTASDNLFSYYFMAEAPVVLLDQDFVFITGFRIENYVLRLRTISNVYFNSAPLHIDDFNSDLLPAFSLIYRFNQNTNIRLTFSRTVNRPQYREKAPFQYYTFEDQTYVRGNPALKEANIANYDIRYEMFPNPGELISLSMFLKELRNPIENVFEISTGQNDRTFKNSPFARNAGFELEYRTSLGKIWQMLDNINLIANYSRIWSKIEEVNISLNRNSRPMQGQSPYVINVSLGYQNTSWDVSANLAYNRFGKRIVVTAGESGLNDIYEQPRDLIDFVLTKGLGENLEFKFSIKDLLAKSINYLQKDVYQKEILVRQYTTNTKLSLGVSYRL